MKPPDPLDCGDLPPVPCAQMGALAVGLLVLLGGAATEGASLLLGGEALGWALLVVAGLAAGVGALLGLRLRARLLAPGRSLSPLHLRAALLGFFGGALLGASAPLWVGLLRATVLGLSALAGSAWAASAIRRIGMTC